MKSATEDYLKRILAESEETGRPVVSLGRLASLSGVTPGTITAMMKKLANDGLLDYLPRNGVRLTGKGNREAARMLRRHRLIELFLVESLGLDWAAVHAEAEILEHAVSDRIVDRIDEMLGFPSSDPHGDPIPRRTGGVSRKALMPLHDVPAEQFAEISRIVGDEPEFLDYLKTSGLTPRQRVRVITRDDVAQTVTLAARSLEVTLSFAVAAKILVVLPEV